MRIYKWMLLFTVAVILTALWEIPVCARPAGEGGQLVIALDPGHGGKENGAYYYGLKEKDINLRLAELVRAKLQQFEGIEVVLTREEDEEVSLSQRAERAKQAGADILISLHCNASASHGPQGASVYISTGEKYREELRRLADYFLGEFEAAGLQNAGTFARVTQMGGRRADGSFDDYYGVLRHSYNNGMPSVIVEHCYMDAEEDKEFLHTEEGMEKLAAADANGIAAFYGLKRRDGKRVVPKQAQVYGGTTKAIENQYFDAPNITGIRLIEYDGASPGIAEYEVEVEDGIGITSIYLVYKNVQGHKATIFLIQADSLKTGKHRLKAYVPEYLSAGSYTLSYIGAGNASGYDAGYNNTGSSMAGFGKCDWLNTFSYGGEADLYVEKEGSISTAHARKMDYEIQIGLRNRHNLYPVSVYPN